MQRNSSFRGTWSWNSSNFHRDDVMDSSYNDPYYTPLYSLDDIDGFIIAVRSLSSNTPLACFRCESVNDI